MGADNEDGLRRPVGPTTSVRHGTEG
jgi:hypothetical protein